MSNATKIPYDPKTKPHPSSTKLNKWRAAFVQAPCYPFGRSKIDSDVLSKPAMTAVVTFLVTPGSSSDTTTTTKQIRRQQEQGPSIFSLARASTFSILYHMVQLILFFGKGFWELDRLFCVIQLGVPYAVSIRLPTTYTGIVVCYNQGQWSTQSREELFVLQ